MLVAATVLTLLLALVFAVISSGHDVSNAIAVPVRHRALTPRRALLLSAGLNALGVGLAVALMPREALTGQLQHLLPGPRAGLLIAACALIVSIAWALLTWRRGLPASMGATLTGSVLGAATTASVLGLAEFPGGTLPPLLTLLLPVVLGPVLAFALGWVVLIPVVHLASRFEADQVTMTARAALAIGSTAVNLGHGAIHGPRMISLLCAIVAASGLLAAQSAPVWASASIIVALCLAAGSLLGGWRIARTISSRMVRPDAVRGATAQTIAGALVLPAALGSDLQLSTSQTAASAVLGTGINQRFRSTNHAAVARVLACWALTPAVCALASALLVALASPLLSL